MATPKRTGFEPSAATPRGTGDFKGAKVAVLAGDRVVTLLRDDRPDIPFPGQWDLLGGGREGGESPTDCVLREAFEEAGLRLRADELLGARAYDEAGGRAWFFAVRRDALVAADLRLGEGQALRLMPTREFLMREDAIAKFRSRLRDFLDAGGAA